MPSKKRETADCYTEAGHQYTTEITECLCTDQYKFITVIL